MREGNDGNGWPAGAVDWHSNWGPNPWRTGVAPERFLTTPRRSIDDHVARGEWERLWQLLMLLYWRPLCAYAARSRYFYVGEPADLVNGYFAYRLAREDTIERWRADGRPLRTWLRKGLFNWMSEQAAKLQRERGHDPLPPDVADEADEDEAMDREYAEHLWQAALAETAVECRRDGLEVQWRAFVAHWLEGRPYKEVGAELGLEEGVAEVRARVPARRFRRNLRRALIADGVPPERIDQVLRDLFGPP